jgi:hypothetical protein
MIKQTTFEHNGSTYTINTLPASKGLSVMKDCMKLGGASIREYLAAGDEQSAIGGVIEGLVANMDNVDIEKLLKNLVSTVSKDNMAINFDNEFAGNYGDLFKICKEVFTHNFGSVFSLVGSVSE